MPLRFTKMHGAGNDFMVIDAISQSFQPDADTIVAWADRHFGVGFDQLLLVEAPDVPHADFRYRIFNADGGEVEHCGNGARCFARFVRAKNLTTKSEISVSTMSGIIVLRVMPDEQVQVDMGRPNCDPSALPFNAAADRHRYEIRLEDEAVSIGAVSMGNPHAVMLVDDVDKAPVHRTGPLLESHRDFPRRVNVGFMQVVDRDHIRLRVYERGAGETLACGTGACAAVAVGRRWGILSEQVKVELTGGNLLVNWDGAETNIMMTGPAEFVYEGEISLPDASV